MALFGLVFLVVALILMGVGMVMGLCIFAVAAAAVGLGMVSTSVACGVLQKKPSTGLRAFFYQFFVAVFFAAGIAATWLASTIGELSLPISSIFVIGALSGISVGLGFGLIHSWLLDLVAGQLKRFFADSVAAA
jgi:hypothetical protein